MVPALPRCEFTTTRWSVVLQVGGATAAESAAALEQLCRDYWYPLYAYVRRRGYSPEDAADLTQGFFAKLLARDFVGDLTPDGGRFRSYLLTLLHRYLIREWKRGQRQKRGGSTNPLSLDALIEERGEASYVSEVSHDCTPEHLYQRAWAETLLARAMERLRAEVEARAPGQFAMLYPYLTADDEAPTLDVAAVRSGLSLPAFKSQLHRFRQRHRELLLEEVGQTVGDRREVAEELRGLLQALETP